MAGSPPTETGPSPVAPNSSVDLPSSGRAFVGAKVSPLFGHVLPHRYRPSEAPASYAFCSQRALAAVCPTASETPLHSTARWRLEPCLPRSVGVGAIFGPEQAHSPSRERPRPGGRAELFAQPLPHPGLVPFLRRRQHVIPSRSPSPWAASPRVRVTRRPERCFPSGLRSTRPATPGSGC